jgi:GTP-binding protein Era
VSDIKVDSTTRSGFVAVVGRPNAGKSSLLNSLVGEDLALVSSKENATRKRMNIIVMHKRDQIIFIDTPGIHNSEQILNKFMLDEALKAIGDADLILFLSPVSDSLKYYEEFLRLNQKSIPHILVLTKIDRVNKKELLKKLSNYSKYQKNFLELIPVTIKKSFNSSLLLDSISKYLPKHPLYFDQDILTTNKMKDIYKEYIREAIFEKTSKEIPYFSDVVVEQVIEESLVEKVFAKIVVDKKSQKIIMIGNNGDTLKRVGKMARMKIEDLSGKKVFLKLFVVVKPNWSKDKAFLKELGYNLS